MNKEIWITVLDYAVSGIRVYHLTDVPTDTDADTDIIQWLADIDIERWLYDNDPGYKEATCYYMCSLEKPGYEYEEAKYHD